MAQKGLDIDALQAGEYTGNQGPFGTNLVPAEHFVFYYRPKQKSGARGTDCSLREDRKAPVWK